MPSLFNLLSLPQERPLWLRVGVVIGCVSAAIALRFHLHPWMGTKSPYALLLPAVMISAWGGGVRAGLAAGVAGMGLAAWFFLERTPLGTPADAVVTSLMTVQVVMVSLLCGALHRVFAGWRAARRQAALEFENMADHAPGFVWATGPDSARGFVNQCWLTFTGAEPGRSHVDRLDFVHPGDVERVRTAVERARVNRSPYHIEYRLRRADGVYRWILEHAVPRFDPDGGFHGFIGSGTDITSSHQEREDLLFLSGLQRVLASSLDLDKTAEAVSRAIVPAVADWCCIQMLDETEGGLRPVRVHHRDEAKARRARELEESAAPFGAQSEGIGRIFTEGEARLVSAVDDAFLRATALSEEHLVYLRSLGLVSFLGVPLRVRGRIVGVLSIATAESLRTLGHDTLQLALKVGGIAAFALDNARLHQSVRRALAAESEARKAREQSERRFRAAWDADLFGICFLSPDGRVEAGNDAFLRLCGGNAADLAAGRLELRSRIGDRQVRFGTFIWECIGKTGRCDPFEKNCVLPDGRVVPVLVGGSLQPDRESCIVFVLDLSARKSAEHELERQRALLKTIIDAVPAMVGYLDPRERFILHNRQYERWLGLGHDDIHGKTLLQLVGGERYAEVEPHLRAALAGKSVRFEKTILAPGRRNRDAMITYHPDIAADGRVVGVVVHAFDITESRQMAQAVERSEKRYRTLITASAAIVWTATPDGRIRETNGWEDFTGDPIGGDAHASWIARIHPEDRRRVEELWTTTCREARDWDCTYRLLAADGRYHHVQSRAAAVAGADGEVEEWVGTVSDISLRVEAEQSLRKKEAELKLIVDTVPALVAYVDNRQRYLLVNQAYQKWFGVDPEKMRGRSVADVVGPRAYEMLRDKIERVLAGEEVRYEGLVPYRGVARWVNITLCPHRGEGGSVLGYFGLILDISERKQTEQRIADLLERYRFLADAMPQNVWTANAAGEQDYVNRRWVEYTGLSADAGSRNRWADIVHPEDLELTRRRWSHSVATGQPYEMEHRLRDSAGNYQWFLSLAMARRDEHGRVVQWVGSATCIENIRRAYAELADARAALRRHADNLENEVRLRTARLEEVNAELEAFTYSASHDLRVPLHHIHGFSEAILEDPATRLSPDSQANMRLIVAATARMDTLVIDLLAYSRMSRGEFSIAPTSIDEVLMEVLLHLRASIQSRDAEVRVERPLPVVPADRVGLHQVLANLVANALKFVAPGQKPLVTIRAEQRGARVRLWVEDRGIGIDPRHHAAIFKMFHRLHGNRDYEGTGIGLSLVKKAMARMGGECGVESSPGQGSRFWLEFQPSPKVEVARPPEAAVAVGA